MMLIKRGAAVAPTNYHKDSPIPHPLYAKNQLPDCTLIAHGLREGISGDNLRDIDQVLENITYIELLRRGYGVTTGNNNGKEIDFVAEKTGEKAYFQVCYLLADEKTMFPGSDLKLLFKILPRHSIMDIVKDK